IPPLLKLFDDMRLDRRSVATALTFGLKAPYIMIPAGFGLIFHRTIVEGMTENGVALTMKEAAYAMLIPGVGMIFGLLVAIFITYRHDRVVSVTSGDKVMDVTEVRDMTWNRQHILTIFAIFAALLVQIITGNLIDGELTGLAFVFLFVVVPFKQVDMTINMQHICTIFALFAALLVQIITGNLIAGALTGLALMFLFVAVPFKQVDKIVHDGIGMMGSIAFVMLVASGFGNILQETGA